MQEDSMRMYLSSSQTCTERRIYSVVRGCSLVIGCYLRARDEATAYGLRASGRKFSPDDPPNYNGVHTRGELACASQ